MNSSYLSIFLVLPTILFSNLHFWLLTNGTQKSSFRKLVFSRWRAWSFWTWWWDFLYGFWRVVVGGGWIWECGLWETIGDRNGKKEFKYESVYTLYFSSSSLTKKWMSILFNVALLCFLDWSDNLLSGAS